MSLEVYDNSRFQSTAPLGSLSQPQGFVLQGGTDKTAALQSNSTTTNTEQSNSSNSSKSLPLELKELFPPTVHPLFETPKTLSKQHINPDLQQLASLVDGSVPILKFSELFAPTRPAVDSFVPRKKTKTSHHQSKPNISEVGEPDEQQIFLQPLNTQNRFEDVDDAEDSDAMGHPLGKAQLDTSPIEDSNVFSLIQQRAWEDEIYWETEENQSNLGELDNLNRPQKSNTVQIPLDQLVSKRRNLWGELQEPTENRLKDSHTDNQESVPMEITGGVSKQTSSSTKAKVLNSDLNTGDWEKAIMWDDKDSPTRLTLPTELLIDIETLRNFSVEDKSLEASGQLDNKLRGRKRKEQDLEKELEQLDKFNLSNDLYYRQSARSGRVRQSLKKTSVIHSEPALKLSMVKPHLNEDDLENFHRPKLRITSTERIKLAPFRKEKVKGKLTESQALSQKGEFMKHKGDLSAKDGRVILMEYSEEHPLMISNFGMGSKVRNYYRKKNSSENPLLRFEDGENVLLDQNDESPFLGDVVPGSTVQALDNNLFRAPIFKHNPVETDFLVVRSPGKKNAFIREIPAIYTVGQIQPKMEVYAPNSRASNNYIKNRLQAFIYRLFLKKGDQRLRISDIMTLFPEHSETSIRKRLKDCADFQRGGDDSGWWTVKDQSQLPNEEELRQLVTPEMVCLYESMLAGQRQLHKANIRRYTSPPTGLANAVHQIASENPELEEGVQNLEEELLLTSWNLSSNFLMAMQGKCMLQLTGLGDPSSGRGEGFSYIKMPQKNTQPGKKKKDNAKTQVTGTDADLRKLSLENARLVLLNFGVTEAEIQRLSRWQRIALVRKKSSDAAASGEGGLTKFARGQRYSLQQQQSQYKEQIQGIFENQIKALSAEKPVFSDDEEEGEDFEDLERDLERMLGPKKRAGANRTREEENDEDKAEFEKLLEEELQKKDETSTPPESNPILLPTFQPGQMQKVIKRSYTVTNPDGTKVKREEVITDPKKVQEMLQRQRDKEKRRRDIEAIRKARSALTPEEEAERQNLKRERRRLQEQLRRLKKNEEKREDLKEKLATGQVEESSSTIKCGACGLPGHMRTNRCCPLYEQTMARGGGKPKLHFDDDEDDEDDLDLDDDIDEEDDEEIEEVDVNPELVKVEGTKLRFPKEAITPKLETRQIHDDYLARPRIQNRRRRGATGAQVELCNTLESIWKELRAHPNAFPFTLAVNPKHFPDYYEVIKNPISLAEIKEKIRLIQYQSREEFLDDMKLLVNNCHIYNKDRNPHLPPMADSLYDTAVKAIAAEEAKFTKLEQEIQNDNNNDNMNEDGYSLSPIDNNAMEEEDVDVLGH